MADWKNIAIKCATAVGAIVIPGSLIALAGYGIIKLINKNKLKPVTPSVTATEGVTATAKIIDIKEATNNAT